MQSLPIVPASCSLDELELRAQLGRYREAAAGARVLERDPRHLVIRVSDDVPETVVERLIAVERDCCPFFDLDWQPGARRLRVAVPSGAHEPALDAVAFALGLPASPV